MLRVNRDALAEIKLLELVIEARATNLEETRSLYSIARGLLQGLEYPNPLSLPGGIPADRPEIGGFDMRPDGDQIRTGQLFMGRRDHGTLNVML